jgi:hypothetical protein
MASLYLKDPADTPLLDAFYAGCFLGMSAPERLSGWFQPLLGALVLTVMLVLVRMLLPGIGGGLGLAAFVTMLVVVALTFRARPQGHVARHATGTIVYPISGVFALGCFVLLLLSAPRQPLLDRATQVEAAMPATPSPALSQVAVAVSHVANDAPPLDAPAAGAGSVDLAISLELPHDIKMEDHALPDSTEQQAPEPSTLAVSSVPHATAAAEAVAAPARTTSDSAAPVMVDPQRDRAPVDDAVNTDEKLFHEFMQWRAAHGGGTAQGRPQPVRAKPRSASLVGLVTPAPVPARPVRPRPPSSIDPIGWPVSMHPSRPPRPIRNATGNPPSNAAP